MQVRTFTEAAEAARARILDALGSHAAAVGHPFRSETVHVEARDGETWLGGLIAHFGVDWVFVELLAVDEAARGRGTGARLMAEVEAMAKARGMTGIWLDTFSFQAPEFYRRLGYAEFGRIDDYPRGEARHFFAKRLDGAA